MFVQCANRLRFSALQGRLGSLLLLMALQMGWTGRAGETVALEWDSSPSSNVAGYRLLCGTESGQYTRIIDVGPATSGTVTGLEPGVTYYFAAAAYSDAQLESAPCPEINYTVPLPLEVTWTAPSAIIYGTPLGSQQLNGVANVPGRFSYVPEANTLLPAGGGQTLSLIFVPDDQATYPTVTNSVSIDVLPAPLSVTAKAQTKTYGTPDPAVTVDFAGFVNGDTPASLSGALSFTRAPGENVGTYAVIPRGLTSPNYSLSFNPGTLTVAKAALSIVAENASRPKGCTNPPFTATVAGWVNGDTLMCLASSITMSTEATAASPEGAYPIHIASGTNPNYNITCVEGTLIVTPPQLWALVLSESEFRLRLGGAKQVQASGRYTDGTLQDLASAVIWSSSDPSVASVDASGFVKGMRKGTATLTATVGLVTASTTVTVTQLRLELVRKQAQQLSAAAASVSELPEFPTWTVFGSAGMVCVIEATTDLVAWEPILTLTLTDDSTTFVDEAAVTLPNRFYRAILSE